MTDENPIFVVQRTFREALDKFRANAPVLILGHNDADGLAASALLAQALNQRALGSVANFLFQSFSYWDCGHSSGGSSV